jgi:hypothetical protein
MRHPSPPQTPALPGSRRHWAPTPVDGPAIAPHAAEFLSAAPLPQDAAPSGAARIAHAAAPPVPPADEQASGTTPLSTDRVDEPDGAFVTTPERRLSPRSVTDVAATGIDTVAWSPTPEKPVAPAPAPAAGAALLRPAAAEPVFIVDDRDAGGPPGFWARKHLCRLRPRLLR